MQEELLAADKFHAMLNRRGANFLAELQDPIATTANLASYWAPRVRDWARARRVAEAGDGDAQAFAESTDPLEYLAETAQARREVDTSPVVERTQEGFPTVAVADVPDFGPVRWLVDRLWGLEAVGIIGAEPKSWKSFLSVYLGVCVAAGMPVFGQFPAQRGRVLLFNAEDKPPDTRSRVERMCRALDLDLRTLDLHLVDVPAMRLDDPAQSARLNATVAHMRPSLVLLDPLRNLHGLDENDAQIVSALLAPLRLIQRQHQCSVMVVHHMSKLTDEERRRPGQRLRGSSALHGWVDSALYLQPKGDGDNRRVRCVVEHRNAPAHDPFWFRMRDGRSIDGDALWLELTDEEGASGDGELERVEKQVRAHEALLRKILHVVEKSIEPITSASQVYERLGGKKAVVLRAVKELMQAGRLHQDRKGNLGTGPDPSAVESVPAVPGGSRIAKGTDREPVPAVPPPFRGEPKGTAASPARMYASAGVAGTGNREPGTEGT